MKDSNLQQFVGLLGGIASLVLPYTAFFMGFGKAGDMVFFFIALGIALIVGIVGLIVSAISIKKANEYEDRKYKGVIGLITSIVGTITSLIMFLIYGGILLLAVNLQ